MPDITTTQELRQRPLYTLAEVAHYTRVPLGVLRRWSDPSGVALLALADPASRSPCSFANLVEAHVLAALRRLHRVKMSAIRSAIAHLREQCELRHPLADVDLLTDGRELFYPYLGIAVSASAGGQGTIAEVMNRYLERIERDRFGAARFYPYLYDNCPKHIVMDPARAFGRPVIQGTRITTTMIYERYTGGESLGDLAADYALTTAELEEALRCEISAPAA